MTYPILTILFNAPPRVGKDTLARLVPEYLPGPVQQLCYKEALYDETFARIEPSFRGFVPRKWWGSADYDELKDDEHAQLVMTDGFTGTARQCLIHTSEDIIKPTKGLAYFGEQVAKNLQPGCNILTDGGFREELDPVLAGSDHVLVIQLERSGYYFEAAGDSRRYLDPEQYPDLRFVRRNITGDRPAASAEMLGKYLVNWVCDLAAADPAVQHMKTAVPAPIEETFG